MRKGREPIGAGKGSVVVSIGRVAIGGLEDDGNRSGQAEMGRTAESLRDRAGRSGADAVGKNAFRTVELYETVVEQRTESEGEDVGGKRLRCVEGGGKTLIYTIDAVAGLRALGGYP